MIDTSHGTKKTAETKGFQGRSEAGEDAARTRGHESLSEAGRKGGEHSHSGGKNQQEKEKNK